MILYMYIHVAPRQELATPWGRNFYVNRNILSLRSFVASFKSISLKSDFIHFFSRFLQYMYIAPEQGQTASRGQSFKKMSLKSDFIQFFSWFNTCIYPQGRGRQPTGNKILMSAETPYHLNCPFVASSKEISLISDFIQLFSWFNTCISPGAGGIQPQGTKLWCQQKRLVTSVICC